MQNFYEKVYNLVQKVPKGKVTTYGEIAKALGNVRLSRAVGYALHANRYFGKVPCHRVVNRYGELALNFVFGSCTAQKAMLEAENVLVHANKVDLKKYFYSFENTIQ